MLIKFRFKKFKRFTNLNYLGFSSTRFISSFENLINIVGAFEKKNSQIENAKIREKVNDNSFFIKILGNGNSGTCKSLVLHVNGENYLFNCGEGTQRILNEIRDSSAKTINDIFLTKSSWTECVSSLNDLLYKYMKSRYQVSEFIRFHSPFNLRSFLLDTYHLLKLSEHKFSQHDYDKHSVFTSSKNLQVEVIKFEPHLKSSREGSSLKATGIQNDALLGTCFTTETEGQSEYASDVVYGYLCTINKTRLDEFNRACRNFNLSYEQKQNLKRKRSIVKNNRVLKIERVLPNNSQSLEFYKILILDLPLDSYLPQLKSLAKSSQLDDLDLVVHLSSNEILNNASYKSFLGYLDEIFAVDHIFLDERFPNLASEQIYLKQSLLNKLDASIFPFMKPPKLELNSREQDELFSYTSHLRNCARLVMGTTSKVYRLNKGQSSFNHRFKLNDNFYSSNNPDHKSQSSENDPLAYPEILFLGTSSARSRLDRNQSGILVNLDENASILMDCGEGILGQFIRFYGEEDYMKQLVKVKAIYLSHAHLDHYNGVFTFVKARQRAVEKLKDKDDKVFICAPANLFSLFKTTSSLFQPEVNHPDGLFLSSINLIDNHWLDYSDKPVRRTTDRTELIKQRVDSLKAALGLSNIEAMPVVHIENATALVFKHQLTNFKLVFSGDCVPSAELVKLGQQCDLLIHEATYSKHDVARAFENKHSTVLQAIEVGKSMKAAHTCITHFGKKILQRHSEEVFQNKDIIVAHDNMLLNRKNLGLAKRLNKELEEINNTINSTTLIINNFFS